MIRYYLYSLGAEAAIMDIFSVQTSGVLCKVTPNRKPTHCLDAVCLKVLIVYNNDV